MILERVEYKIMVIWHESSGMEAVWERSCNATEIGRKLSIAVERYPLDRFWIRKLITVDITADDIEKLLMREA